MPCTRLAPKHVKNKSALQQAGSQASTTANSALNHGGHVDPGQLRGHTGSQSLSFRERKSESHHDGYPLDTYDDEKSNGSETSNCSDEVESLEKADEEGSLTMETENCSDEEGSLIKQDNSYSF